MKKKQYTSQMAILLTLVAFAGFSVAHAQTWNLVGVAGFSDSSAGASIALNSSGTPYVVFQDLTTVDAGASVMKFDGTNWVTVGAPSFSPGEADALSIAVDGSGTPYVVFIDNSIADSSREQTTVMKFNGTNWVNVGNPDFTAGGAEFNSIAIDGSGTPYVAFLDGASFDKATVMKFNDTGWEIVGSAGFSASEADFTSLALDGTGTPYVSYEDDAVGAKATVMKFNGAIWETVGAEGFSAAEAYMPSLAINDSGFPYVAYADFSLGGKATVMKYNGASWVAVGSPGFSLGMAEAVSIKIDGSGAPYVAFTDDSTNMVTVMKFNGSAWATVGSPSFPVTSASSTTSLAIDASGVPFLAYKYFGDSDKITVMSFGIPATEVNSVGKPSGISLAVYPNPNNGNFTVDLSSGVMEAPQVTITNVLGEKIKDCIIPANMPIDLQLNAPPGVYFISLVTGSGSVIKKIVVE